MTKYDRFHMFMAGPLIVGFIMFIGPMDQIMSFLLISRRAILNSELTKS